MIATRLAWASNLMRRLTVVVMMALMAVTALPFYAQANLIQQDVKTVELRGLNKVTARVSTIKGALTDQLSFGNLRITVKSCWSAPPGKRPEHAALLHVIENRPGEGPQAVFSGWMFASSPALSSLEHPVYDISVIACHAK